MLVQADLGRQAVQSLEDGLEHRRVGRRHPVHLPTETLDAFGESVDSVVEPVDAVGEVADLLGEPVDSVGEPVDALGQAVDSVVEAVDAVGEVADLLGEPVDSVGEPVDALGQAVDPVVEPVDALGQAVDAVGEVADLLGQPVDPVGQAVDSVVEPVDSLGESVEAFVETLDVAVQPADLAVNAVEPDRYDAHLPLEDADVRSRLPGDLLDPDQTVAHRVDLVPIDLHRVIRVLYRLLAAMHTQLHEIILQALDALFEGGHGHRASSNCRAAWPGARCEGGCMEGIAISSAPSSEGDNPGNSRRRSRWDKDYPYRCDEWSPQA
ncbi:collagen-like triple helix repeat-containing protein [Microbispora bryophytorum]|nr:collagen-like triple helix repeat-containing protein [Microbispora bryophytorum]